MTEKPSYVGPQRKKETTEVSDMGDSYYDVAQVCQNGHVINSLAQHYPNSNQDYCDKCGTATIVACPGCKTPIRGYYHVPGVIGFSDFAAPAHCYRCGSPFPWTQIARAAAQELAETLDALSAEECSELKESIDELLRETPRTRVAETKFKKLMRKAGKDAYEGMKSILTDVVSETVKRTPFGSQG
jgi:hypothetical protein